MWRTDTEFMWSSAYSIMYFSWRHNGGPRLRGSDKWPDSEVIDTREERMISSWERAAEDGVLCHQLH